MAHTVGGAACGYAPRHHRRSNGGERAEQAHDTTQHPRRKVVVGGQVICAGIHMSDIPSFPYHDLWGERVLRSVANLTRHDGEAFLALAPQAGITTSVTSYPLAETPRALDDLRHGRFQGAAVIAID